MAAGTGFLCPSLLQPLHTFKSPNKFAVHLPERRFRIRFRCHTRASKPDVGRDGVPMKPPARRMRGAYGTSRKSILKKTLAQEQVEFTAPISDDPVVGIIGGGIAGLTCASALADRGIRSTVFDTGVHGLGGRMGTRMVDGQWLIFDHAAQYFTASDPRFQVLVDRWMAGGLVREWTGLIGEIHAGALFHPVPSPPRYIGMQGMRPIADSILSPTCNVNVVRPCWISKLEPFNGKWHLSENGTPHGCFDAIVIAHNGKCANRLLSSSGLPKLTKQMKMLKLSAIWALLAAFSDPLIPQNGTTVGFEGAFVKGIPSLSWMGNNTKKLFPGQTGRPECWTFFSTAAYGKENKVPQENIPNVTAEKVKNEMLEGVASALGLHRSTLKPIYTRVQLWGAALPVNTPGVPFIFDPYGRAGICGDWLLGSNIEAAVLSGLSLADHMANYLTSEAATEPDQFAVGLENSFQDIDGHDIGQFARLKSELVCEPV